MRVSKSVFSKTGRMPGSLTISRSSAIVNATCRGPLRPTMYTCFTLLLASSSSACSVMSVFLRISIGVSNILAVSNATLPCPNTTAVSVPVRSTFS
ncbi:hypothetical protein NP493_7g06021 [Ridgeia piscesae]|uniref:Uncharacterized protein n=1 Tax=Ridgeia piscesae TaxID=27915 RepID=A0AAD9PFC3_RIDPI|nr:hypothetical protein NP493_7g06021 [Ridgeia piscesae]